MSNYDRMTAFCQRMPALAERQGFGLGWDPDIVFQVDRVEGDEWDNAPDEYPMPEWAHSSAMIEAVRFARHVWNAHNRPPSLAFWDSSNRAAFLAWAEDPWWA
jgi:hypothetical protein